MRLARTTLLIASIGAAAQAGSFTPPKGCAAYLTVQTSNCQVEHHWTCEQDPKGTKWHTEIGQNGPVYIGKIDDEAQWIDSFQAGTNGSETLITPATDPASLSELLLNGLDTYTFSLNTPEGKRDVTGYDRIAERNLRIDGELLHRTEYDIQITDAQGQLTYASNGSEYVSETHRRFFSGYGTITGPDTPFVYKASPVEFIYPADKGYLDNTPKYGCDVLSARFAIQ